MYMHKDTDGKVTEECLNDLQIFMHHAGNTPITQKKSIRCYVLVKSARIQNPLIRKLYGTI